MEEQVILGHLNADEELAGLSATTKRKIAVKVAEINDRKAVVPQAVLRLNTRRDILSQKQRKSLEDGDSTGTYMHHYRAIKFTPATDGMVKMIDVSVNPAVGVTSFKDQTLDAGQVMLIDEVAFAFGFDTTITDPGQIEYSSYGTPYTFLQNMEVKIEIGNNLVLDKLPMREFLRWEPGAAPNNLTRNNVAVRMPVDSYLWSDSQALKITLLFPKAFTVPSGINFFVRVDLYGAGLAEKS